MKGWVGLVGWPITDGLSTKWSPVSCRSRAGQGNFAGQRPTFYHRATPPVVCLCDPVQNFPIYAMGIFDRVTLTDITSCRFLATGSLYNVTSRELSTSKIKHSVWHMFANSVELWWTLYTYVLVLLFYRISMSLYVRSYCDILCCLMA